MLMQKRQREKRFHPIPNGLPIQTFQVSIPVDDNEAKKKKKRLKQKMTPEQAWIPFRSNNPKIENVK